MNVVNVPGKYSFTLLRTCLKIDMVEMMKCSKKMRRQKLPDKKQFSGGLPFLSISSRATRLTSKADASPTNRCLKASLGQQELREFGEQLWGRKEIGCAVEAHCRYRARCVRDTLFWLF